MDITAGAVGLSTAMSLYDRCIVGSYLSSFSTVVSPDRQKEKNVTTHAVQSMMSLNEGLSASHTALSYGQATARALPVLALLHLNSLQDLSQSWHFIKTKV